MKTVGIICEYNPLHLGHAFQMERLRALLGEDTAVICVMSGNYVQRGEPAVLDKFTRARGAVLAGADLVLELPVTRVLSSAEGFAMGGVEVLDRLFCVDYLSFGSESGDGETLLVGAEMTLDAGFDEKLKEKLAQGLSYAAARQKTLAEATGQADFARKPNVILGLEYCRALLMRNSRIKPLVLKREGDYHEKSLEGKFPSATALRSAMEDDTWLSYVPEGVRELFRQAPRYSLSAGERAVLARLRSMPEEAWEKTAHGSEGLWRKVMKNVRSLSTVEEILEASLSKRYPRTRLSRLLLCAYLGIGAEMLKEPLTYTRILAFSPKGRRLLRTAKEQGDLVLLNPGERPESRDLWERERRLGDLYSLFAVEDSRIQPAMEEKARYLFERK